MANDRILVCSDLHAPFMHKNAVAFLAECKRKYKPTRVVFSGDEADKQALSYHEHDPDLPSAGHELDLTIHTLTPIYSMFPNADLCNSNHGSLPFRKAKTAGIPRGYLRPCGEALRAPRGWKWHDRLLLHAGKRKLLFVHSASSRIAEAVSLWGVCITQGHHHCVFDIQYVAQPAGTLWGMTVGCLIDDAALAFAYNKLQVKRPMLGCGVIINGEPKLVPMNRHEITDEWDGEVA